ncbi:MAG: hypothetical protein OZSIB_0545 [Candidatus Ozemobacter sibiricus]|jgi:hypothetical protein|uniref:Uncharacterized protein n=1 Tax=Candidatus Ozemobacter sibiricus TaxID=2268124 RepID=A0A367ZLL1_9BACT|nr:MAG: hypothetical protein OZSIB_0545 [Candidatus Ozemobacter sibiricus]
MGWWLPDELDVTEVRRDRMAERRFLAFLRAAEQPRPHQPFDIREREDRLSAVTLAHTLAFLLYSLLVPLVVLGLMVLPPLRLLSLEARSVTAVGLFVTLEWFLFRGVSQGWLPCPDPENVRPFNERQLELGVALVSFGPWLLRFDPQMFFVFHVVVNALLVIGVIVFFLTKSFISRQWRWGVLRVLLLPLLQFWLVARLR